MKLTGTVKENKIVLPEGIGLLEGAVVEFVVSDVKDLASNKDDVAKKTPEPSEEAKRCFWKLIGAGDSGKSDVSVNKHQYLSEALDERPTEGWETLINSLLDSGLIMTGAWPLHTEMKARLRAKESARYCITVSPEKSPI